MEFDYTKVIGRNVTTFIPLADDTINSSLVVRGRSLMDSRLRPLLYFLVRMKPTSTNVFLQVAKIIKAHGEHLDCAEDGKYFPAKSLKLIPHHIDRMGMSIVMQKDDSTRQHSRAFWLYGASQHPLPLRNEPHLSALVCLPPFPMLDKHIYTTLISRAIKKQLCGPVRFHYACLLPYTFVTTVLLAFPRIVFYGGCSVFIWLPLIYSSVY